MEGRVERDRPSYVTDGEVACEVPAVLTDMLDVRASEYDARELRDVEELTGFEMSIAEGDARPDGADVDSRVRATTGRVLFVEEKIAFEGAEAAVQRRDKRVREREASGGLTCVDDPGARSAAFACQFGETPASGRGVSTARPNPNMFSQAMAGRRKGGRAASWPASAFGPMTNASASRTRPPCQ